MTTPPSSSPRVAAVGQRAPRSTSRRDSALSWSLIAAVAFALAGCGGESSATPSSSPSSPSIPPSTKGSPPQGYAVPSAAKAHTHEGAKAFVKFYWETLGRLDARPEKGVIERFSAPACGSCQDQIATIDSMVSEGVHVETSGSVTRGEAVRADSTQDSVVVTFEQSDAGSVRVGPGSKRAALKPTHLFVAVRADWSGDGWKLRESGADPR